MFQPNTKTVPHSDLEGLKRSVLRKEFIMTLITGNEVARIPPTRAVDLLLAPPPLAVTLDFETRYAVWERAPAYATSGGRGPGVGGHRSFNVTTVFRINQQPILYTPPVSEVLQSGWSKVRPPPPLSLSPLPPPQKCIKESAS